MVTRYIVMYDYTECDEQPDTPVHRWEDIRRPNDEDAEIEVHRRVGGDQPDGRQPSTRSPASSDVSGGEGEGETVGGSGCVQGVHDAEEQRGEVQRATLLIYGH